MSIDFTLQLEILIGFMFLLLIVVEKINGSQKDEGTVESGNMMEKEREREGWLFTEAG